MVFPAFSHKMGTTINGDIIKYKSMETAFKVDNVVPHDDRCKHPASRQKANTNSMIMCLQLISYLCCEKLSFNYL